MKYYKFNDTLCLSRLGMGAMRLPRAGSGLDAPIDEVATEQMIDHAIEHGVNYFDTAWSYHGGQSEVVIGKILSKYPRESWYLADKFPGFDLSNMDNVEAIFEEQLKRCGVEYFDFYLLHNVCELNIDAYLDEKYGICDYLIKQKERGRIHYLGFSVHASNPETKRFLEACGNMMEFGQIQLNYVDWTFQSAKEKMALLDEYNIPVWVMEAMRGGRLADLSDDNNAKLKALRPDENIPAWAFRFIQSIPGIAVTLTGASNLDQLQENINVFKEEKPLSQSEMDTLLSIANDMIKDVSVACTSCGYCLEYCPQQLDIPKLLTLYNEHRFTKGGFIAPMALMALPESKHPRACIACKKCDNMCPQQLKIADTLADFVSRLG